MDLIAIISYAANIVFITWGCATFVKDRKRNKENANLFNAVYEMSKRLSKSATGEDKRQAEDISSFLLSATMNFKGLDRNEIGRLSFWMEIWSRVRLRLLGKHKQNQHTETKRERESP